MPIEYRDSQSNHWEYSDSSRFAAETFEYITFISRINLDKRKAADLRSGKGFIITKPQRSTNIKNDIKNENGIFSPKFGGNINELDPEIMRYRCKCGHLHGKLNQGDICQICGERVIYRDDDVSIFGWIEIKPEYCLIHPNLYSMIGVFIGAQRLERILTPDVKVDKNGNVLKPDPPVKQDEPFRHQGILWFRDNFDAVMEFYLSRNPNKQDLYRSIMSCRDCVFTNSIPVYSARLRPSKIDNGSLRYETTNENYQALLSIVDRINRDKFQFQKKPKDKLNLLWEAQQELNAIYTEIKNILSGKKGDIRAAIGGRCSFSERSVITQDTSLKCDEVKLPFHALMELLQQRIINTLVRTEGMTYASAYKKWHRAQISGKDSTIWKMIEEFIRLDNGLPVLINRNPTISYGGILFMRCVGINDDYTMSIPLVVLKPLAADFDGDTLNIFYLWNQEFIKACAKVFSPRVMYISRNDGKCNGDVLPARDTIINANALRNISLYTEEEIEAIKLAQKCS